MPDNTASLTSEQLDARLRDFALSLGWTPEKAAAVVAPRERVPSLMSEQIDQLAVAMTKAKAAMFSPARNKHVTVTRRKGGTYDFRYASLDVIHDMIRLPLAENGLAIMHLTRPNKAGQLFMATRLLHSSGQYMDTVLPLHLGESFDDDMISGPQKLGSLMTFAKRYSIGAILDISTQEDDDANAAEGNMVIDHEYPVEPNAQLRMLQDRYARLVSAAANARDPAGIGEVLQRWQRGMEFWQRMRLDGDKENWGRLMDLIPAALARVYDDVLGLIFVDSATAATTEAIDRVRELWESDAGKLARAKMKELNPISYGMLFEHLRLQAARVEREAEEAERRQEAQLREQAILASLADEGSPFDGAAAPLAGLVEPEAAPAAEPEADPDTTGGLDQSYRHVFDEHGEVVSDACTLPMLWARIYVRIFQDAENKAAVREHNANGLAWIKPDVDAQVILMQALGKQVYPQPEEQAPSPAPEISAVPATALVIVPELDFAAEPNVQIFDPVGTVPTVTNDERQLMLLPTFEAVVLHRTGKGTPDLTRYVRAIHISLQQVPASQMAAWEVANLPTIDTLPMSTRMTLLGLAAARRQTLGLAA